MKSILDFFPAKEFRRHQKEVLLEVERRFDEGKKVIIIRAPTGSGKSVVARTILSYCGGGYYSSPLLTLVNQVYNDNSKLRGPPAVMLKGRARYSCLLRYKETGQPLPTDIDDEEIDINLSCQAAACQRQKDFDCEFRQRMDADRKDDLYEDSVVSNDTPCHYYRALKRAENSSIVSLPIALLLTSRKIPPKAALAIDEGHETENWLRMSSSLSIYDLTGPRPSSLKSAIPLIEEAVNEAAKVVRKLEAKSQHFTISLEEHTELLKNKKIEEQGTELLKDFEMNRPWAVYVHNDSKDPSVFDLSFRPVLVDKIAPERLWTKGKRIVILSATLNPDLIVSSLGLNMDECHFIDVPSTFPPENTQFIDANIGPIIQSTKQSMLPKMVKRVEEILERERDFRGLIHANSYEFANYLYANLPSRHRERLVFHSSKTRNLAFDDWLNDGKKNSVFVGVGFEEGVDLFQDRARFLCILKNPYGNIGDPLTKERMTMPDGQLWYTNETLQRLVQSAGRAVRSDSDWARIYLVDKKTIEIINSNQKHLPRWFLDSWKLRKGF